MPRPKRQPTMVKVERIPEMDDLIRASWEQLRDALKAAIASGALTEKAGPEHVAVLQPLLADGDGEMVGRMVFEAGFLAAMTTVKTTMLLASQTIPHDCDDPTHAHGPAASPRIGRA